MASEYLLWKARDEKPAPPPPPMTGRDKWKNWLHYHKLWLVAGAVVLWIVGSMAWHLLGIGETQPDYIFAYIGDDVLDEATTAVLQQRLDDAADDRNGDGKVYVELRQYATARSGEAETSLYYNTAATTQLLADITAGESYFFLTGQPEQVQHAYQIFARPDGTPPAEDDYTAADKVLPWGSCPGLSRPSDGEALQRLYLGRRCFYDEKEADKRAANAALWLRLTGGIPE